MSDNDEQRIEELQVLESIYPDYILEASLNFLRLDVPVELDGRYRVLLTNDSKASSPTVSVGPQGVELSHLPPILIDIQLPDGYPTSSAPKIASLHSTHSWLPRELELKQQLQDSWQGEGNLCAIVETVRSGEFLSHLGLLEGECIR